MRRRRTLTLAGGLLAGTIAGCTTPNQVFDTYRHKKNAPTDGSKAGPWPTLAHDSRRSGHAPYGWIPREPAVRRFAPIRRTTEAWPILADRTAYFGARRVENEDTDWRGVGPSGLQAAVDGEGRWFFEESRPLATPTAAGNAIFLTTDGMTRALDRRDGSLCWEYREGTGSTFASPTVVDDVVYIGGNRLFALAATTGAVQWSSNAVPGRIRGTAATANGVFATASAEDGGMVYRFNPETGRQQWAIPLDSAVLVSPVVGELVYVVEVDGRVHALEPSDGSEVWSQEFDGQGVALPALADRTLYITGVTDVTLQALDALTGSLRWEFPSEGRSVAGPTVAEDTVYLPTAVPDGGQLVALEVSGGTLRGSYGLPQRPVSSFVCGPGIGLIAAGRSWGARLFSLTHPAL